MNTAKKKAKKKAKPKAKPKGNGWGVMLKSGKLRTFWIIRPNVSLYESAEHAQSFAKECPGARVVRVQVVEVKRLREAIPPPYRLRVLAEWFDQDDANKGRGGQDTQVQDDLRTWADAIDKALED